MIPSRASILDLEAIEATVDIVRKVDKPAFGQLGDPWSDRSAPARARERGNGMIHLELGFKVDNLCQCFLQLTGMDPTIDNYKDARRIMSIILEKLDLDNTLYVGSISYPYPRHLLSRPVYFSFYPRKNTDQQSFIAATKSLQDRINEASPNA